MSFAQKYRPQTLNGVLDQDRVLETLRTQMRTGLEQPILLMGPPGVGKTTLARIVACTLNCLSPATDGSPCLHCDNCRDFAAGECALFFTEIDGGRTGERSHARQIAEIMRVQPLGAGQRRIVFIDEAHSLDGQAWDALLKSLETPGVAAVILATSEDHRIPRAVRSRCVRVQLHPLSAATLIRLGRDICGQEALPFEADALALLAADAAGQARDFLMRLDELAAKGSIMLAAVRTVVDATGAETAVAVLAQLVSGKVGAAEQGLSDWRELPHAKARGLRNALAFAAQRHLGGAGVAVDELAHFLCVAPCEIAGLWSALSTRAVALRLAPARCAIDWARHWDAASTGVHDAVTLQLAFHAFAHLVLPPGAPLPALPAAPAALPVTPPVRRPRAVRASPPTHPPDWYVAGGVYLTKATVRAQYRAATMLPQAFGLLFNARVDLRYPRFGVMTWDASMRLFSDVTHELGLRVRDWCGDPDFRLHWLCQHEADPSGGFRTWLLLHLPSTLTAQARDWMAERLPTPEGGLFNELGDDVWRAPPTGRAAELHWSLVRELWRALDPCIMEPKRTGGRAPLKDLLGVPSQAPRCAGALPAGERRYSSSKSLASGAWRDASAARMGFVNAFDDRAWDALDTGWELIEHAYRKAETARRVAEMAKIEAIVPPGVSASQDATRKERLAALVETFPSDPMKRPRPTPLW